MAADKKYFWKIGTPPPELQQHSAVKHKIIESYVRDYILTLMKQPNIPKLQLTLVDGFSGGGAYCDEQGAIVDGSPLRMMLAVQEARARLNIGRVTPREVAVNYEFVDIDKDTTEYLKYWLGARTDELPGLQRDNHNVNIQCADFLTVLPHIVQSIQKRKMGERAIFVLDQYNYHDIPLSSIAKILQNVNKAEVILTFNVGSIITFLSNRAANRKPLEHIGLDSYIPWERLANLKAEEHQTWRRTLQRDIAYGIRRETGAQYSTLFFVKPHGLNTWDYWLIHLSQHYKAHEVMKDLHWAHATEFGHELEPGVFVQGYDANRDYEYTGQAPFDFGESSKEACVNGLHEYFGRTLAELRRPVQLGEIVRKVASQSPGTTRHFLEAAKQLHHGKEVIVTGADGRLRRHSKNYRLDDVIEFTPQIRLIGM